MKLRKFFYSLPFFLPAFAFAQVSTFKDLAGVIIRALKGLIAIVFAALAVGVLYGVVRYFANSEDARMRENMKGYLFWAVIGIAVAFALWGILMILSNTLGWGNVGIPYINAPT